MKLKGATSATVGEGRLQSLGGLSDSGILARCLFYLRNKENRSLLAKGRGKSEFYVGEAARLAKTSKSGTMWCSLDLQGQD